MQEVREVLPFGRSGERREEQISRGANGIIKTEGGREGGRGGEEGGACIEQEATARRTGGRLAQFPIEFTGTLRDHRVSRRDGSLVQTSDFKSRVALAQAY